MLQTYTGPHKIVDRPSDSTIKIKVGTFKSGVENIQLHHWSNAKPAALRSDYKEAEMAPRGRPSKNASSSSNGQNATEATAQLPDPPPTVRSTGSEAVPPLQNVNKPAKINKLPTRRSERIRQKNHETSIAEIQELPTEELERFLAGNSNDFSPPAGSPRPWQASPENIRWLNQVINVPRAVAQPG